MLNNNERNGTTSYASPSFPCLYPIDYIDNKNHLVHLKFKENDCGWDQAFSRNNNAYKTRIETLRSYGAEEDLPINQNSEYDFWVFIHINPDICKTELALVDNGNLRAIWKWGKHGHLGIEFFGNQEIQYVVFWQNKPNGEILREANNGTFETINELMINYKIDRFLKR